jgi:hypothetical protein
MFGYNVGEEVFSEIVVQLLNEIIVDRCQSDVFFRQ